MLLGPVCIAPACLTRREQRRLAKREQILEVATRAFLDNGYGRTTMNAISESIGGSKGTLWNHFPSKEALFECGLDYATTDLRRQFSLILDPEADIELALRQFCTAFLTKLTSPDSIALHRLVLGEARQFPEIGRIFFDRCPKAIQELLADFLAVAIERGHLGHGTAFDMAQQLTALCMCGCHQKMAIGVIDKATDEMIVRDVARAIDTFVLAFKLQ